MCGGTPRRLAFLLVVLLCSASLAKAQYLPACPGHWMQGGSGAICLCPDGAISQWVGDRIVCNSSWQNTCPSGGTCRMDQLCCGNYCCERGYYCSANGCMPIGSEAEGE